jgi:homogentisate 1,2-dioxygenase
MPGISCLQGTAFSHATEPKPAKAGMNVLQKAQYGKTHVQHVLLFAMNRSSNARTSLHFCSMAHHACRRFIVFGKCRSSTDNKQGTRNSANDMQSREEHNANTLIFPIR